MFPGCGPPPIAEFAIARFDGSGGVRNAPEVELATIFLFEMKMFFGKQGTEGGDP